MIGRIIRPVRNGRPTGWAFSLFSFRAWPGGIWDVGMVTWYIVFDARIGRGWASYRGAPWQEFGVPQKDARRVNFKIPKMARSCIKALSPRLIDQK